MKKKTVVSVHGGLGNQLFQLGLAVQLSELSEVALNPWKSRCRADDQGKIWISYYKVSKTFSTSDSLLDRFFSLYTRVAFRLAARVHIHGIAGRIFSYLYKSVIQIPRIFQIQIVTTQEMGNFEIPQLLRRNYVFAYFQTLEAVSPIKQQLISDNLEKFLPQRATQVKEKEILILHVRRTDYKENPKIGLLPPNYFKDALAHLSKIYAWDELWLFSDDPQEAVLMVPQEFKDKLVVIPVEGNMPPDTLALMACGNSFILSNSTFGWWAANLAYNPPKHVVVPSKWFNQIDEPAGLIPKAWIRVNI